MFEYILSYLDLYLLGVVWLAAGIATGFHSMGVWQSFQEHETGAPATHLGHQWFFMACVCPPASMLTTRMFFPDIPYKRPRWI